MVELDVNDGLKAKTLEVDLSTLKLCEPPNIMQYIKQVCSKTETENILNINIVSKAKVKTDNDADETVLFYYLNKLVNGFLRIIFIITLQKPKL